ncbi:MAG: hypothetical protein ACLQIB_58705 [Isosphaeraceae bacterium]
MKFKKPEKTQLPPQLSAALAKRIAWMAPNFRRYQVVGTKGFRAFRAIN